MAGEGDFHFNRVRCPAVSPQASRSASCYSMTMMQGWETLHQEASGPTAQIVFRHSLTSWSPNSFLSSLLSLHYYYVGVSVPAENQNIIKEYSDRVQQQWNVTFCSNAMSLFLTNSATCGLRFATHLLPDGPQWWCWRWQEGLAWQPRVLSLVSHTAGFHGAGGV